MAVDILALLSAAALVALLLRPFKSVTIPGYLLAGALIGPHAFRVVQNADQTQAVWQFATVLLMFTIGLHLDLAGVRGGLLPTILTGFVSTAISFALVSAALMAAGLEPPAAMAIGMAVSLSSTAVVLRILEQRRELHRPHGRLAFGVLLVQDLLVLAMMALVPILAAWGRAPDVPAGTTPQAFSGLAGFGVSIGGVVALIVLGRIAFPRLLRVAAWSGETLLVVSAAMALGAAVATAALGFSPELGAFLAGFLLAATPFRYQLAGQLVPLRDLLMAVFFTALGLSLPLEIILHGWWIVAAGVAILALAKVLGIGLAAWAAGASAPVAAYAAVCMFQAGEFSLVLLVQQTDAGILSPEQSAYATAVVVVSLMLTPAAMSWGRTLAVVLRSLPPVPWARASVLREVLMEASPAAATGDTSGAAPLPGLAIIAGFGPVGRAVADTLERQSVRTTLIELNPRTVEKQHRLGRVIVYGDASNREVLERAGIEHAEAIILTMPDEEAVLRACRLIRLMRPDIFIAARVNALSKGLQAMQLGADHTVVEEMATAEAMAREVVTKLRQRSAGTEGPKLYEVER